jgi:hypothetical protein
MSEQGSQKSGMRSESQKAAETRNAYKPIPPANPVGGASGEHKKDTATDHDVAMSRNERLNRQSKNGGEDDETS